MLKYFKYFAVVTFVLVLGAAFFAGVYFRSFAADSVIRKPIEESNIKLAKHIEDNILCKYYPAFKGMQDKSFDQLKNDEYFQKLGKIVVTLLASIPADKINIYSAKGEEIFSTNAMEMVFFDNDRQSLLSTAQAGQTLSRLITSMGIYETENVLTKGSYVETLVPISGAGCKNPENTVDNNPVKLVVEVFNNVSTPWQNLSLFQIVVSAGIVTTFVLLYMALFFTSKKTEKIINKQHEEKLSLERAKSMAETQNQQKSMFLANVSHELRTPLNAIIGFSEIIKDEVMGPVGHPQYKEYITDINSSGVHLLSLINDILDYSKAEAKKLDVESVDIDLSKIARSCLRLVEPRAKEAKVHLVENLPERHVVLSADPKRMKQVILNLLSNSVKFTPEEGQVSLLVSDDQENQTVTLIVSDTGIGIAAKDISKAMAPFGQIDSSISRKYEGTGLGLPLTKKLTELMGGSFEIKSEVGLGTTITLVFPIVKGKVAKEGAEKF